MTDVIVTPVNQSVVIQETLQVVQIAQPPLVQVLTIGIQGPEGIAGQDGQDGADGTNGSDGQDGTDGTNGTDGLNAWTPVLAVATDGDRRVFQIIDWVGGQGTKPTTGLYIAAAGLDPDIADGVDVRGPAGAGGGGGGTVSVYEMVPLTGPGSSAIVMDGVRTMRAPDDLLLDGLKLSCLTAPTGAALIVDIRKNGTSIFLDAASRIRIDAGMTTSVGSAVTPVYAVGFTGFADDDVITIDVKQVGSTIAGAGLIATFIWHKP